MRKRFKNEICVSRDKRTDLLTAFPRYQCVSTLVMAYTVSAACRGYSPNWLRKLLSDCSRETSKVVF